MKTITYAKRCFKEILRDPLTISFGLGFPIVLLLLLSAMQANIPVDLFKIERLAPGIAVFGLSFISLFAATLISKDKESLFLQRLYTTPLRSIDFILGYIIPFVPLSLLQTTITYAIAIILKLPVTINIVYAILLTLPISILFISIGLFFGSLLNAKQVGGICGALLTNLSAWLSGVWFDLELVGDFFVFIAKLLPFVHCVELQRGIISGNVNVVNLLVILLYMIVITTLAVLVFLRQTRKK